MTLLVAAEKECLLEQQSQKVLTNVGPNVKLFFLLSALLLYIMAIIFFSTMLDQMPSPCGDMEEVLLEAGQVIHTIYALDQNLAMEIERLDDMIMDF